jgi:dTDP-glucose 4,6-dehydratase/UDP-glucuronate decarboxylase
MLHSVILEDVERIINDIGESFSILEGKTLLISGGGGFLGGYFLDTIAYLNEKQLQKLCQIICLDNFITGVPRRVSYLVGKPYFTLIKTDISQPFSISRPIHFVIHAASIASPSYYRQYPIETINANVKGLWNLLELTKKESLESFLFLSSSEVYGDPTPENIPTPENYRGNVSFTGPRACYDESKRFGETLCLSFNKTYGMPIKIARPFNIYGPGLRLDDKRVIPDFIRNALEGELITLYSDGLATRSFCYVSDGLTGFWKILLSNHNGEVFNIGNDKEEIRMRDLAKLINELFGSQSQVLYKENPDKDYLTDNPSRRCPDLTKAKSLLSYYPKISLKEGLERTIRWYRGQQ